MDKDQAKSFLKDLIHRMNTQDNRSTAAPYFYVVRRVKWRLTQHGYGVGTTRTVRVDFNGDPTTFHSKEEFVQWAKNYYDGDPDKNIESLWEELEEFTEERYFEDENVFFTEDAYQEHVRLNGHNLERGCSEYYSYVKHAFRNPELSKMFEAIGVLAEEEWKKR